GRTSGGTGGPRGVRLADQHGVRGAHQPEHPPACRRGRATGQHALQGRRRVAAAAGVVSKLPQLLPAPCLPACASGCAGAHQRHGLDQTVATLHAGDGRWSDGPGVDVACSAALSGATVAAASGGVSQPWWREKQGEGAGGGDVCLHGLLEGRHHGAEDCWEAMIALSSRPFCPCDGRRVSLGYLAAGLRYTTRRRHLAGEALSGGVDSPRSAHKEGPVHLAGSAGHAGLTMLVCTLEQRYRRRDRYTPLHTTSVPEVLKKENTYGKPAYRCKADDRRQPPRDRRPPVCRRAAHHRRLLARLQLPGCWHDLF